MSRLVRRTFAPSFIITVAGSASLATADDKPPAPKAPPVIMRNPPRPRPNPTTDRHWDIFQQGKKCFASNAADACPPPPKGEPPHPCNPPPPTDYACPANVVLPVKLIQRANTADCFVDRAPMTCPKGMACNPPAPRKLDCP